VKSFYNLSNENGIGEKMMIIKVDGGISEKILEKLINRLETENNVSVKLIAGKEYSILGLVGDISTIDIKHIQALDYVLDVQRVQEPYKRASRKFKPEDTIVKVGNVEIGGKSLVMMAGPCSVEDEKQIIDTAKAVKAAGANILRGGSEVALKAIKARGETYAMNFIKSACTSNRRIWEHSLSVLGMLAIKLVHQMNLEIPESVEYMKDWAAVAAILLTSKRKDYNFDERLKRRFNKDYPTQAVVYKKYIILFIVKEKEKIVYITNVISSRSDYLRLMK